MIAILLTATCTHPPLSGEIGPKYYCVTNQLAQNAIYVISYVELETCMCACNLICVCVCVWLHPVPPWVIC